MGEIVYIENAEISVKEYKGQRVVTFNGKRIDKYTLLALAIETEQDGFSYKLLRLANCFRDDDVFNALYFATLNTVTDRRLARRTGYNEFDFQKMFNEVYPRISGNQIIFVKNDGENIPDSWVRENGESVPVEVKKGTFDEKALKQLQRYINAYKCKRGIAVGRVLSVILPQNVKFVSLDELEEYQESEGLRRE